MGCTRRAPLAMRRSRFNRCQCIQNCPRQLIVVRESVQTYTPLVDCGSYHPGHDVHVISALHGERGEPRTIRAIADDGTITFTDGSTAWNHDPARLRIILDRCG